MSGMCALASGGVERRFGGKSGLTALTAHNAILNPNEQTLASKPKMTSIVKALHDALVLACTPAASNKDAPIAAVSPMKHPQPRCKYRSVHSAVKMCATTSDFWIDRQRARPERPHNGVSNSDRLVLLLCSGEVVQAATAT